MSANFTVGAFLRVKLRQMDFEQERYVCGNGHDYGEGWIGQKKDEVRFCSRCGTPIKITTVTRRRYPHESELIPVEHEDRLFFPNYSGLPEGEIIFVGNRNDLGDRVSTPSYLGFAPIAAADVDRCIQAFQRNYGDLSALLEPQVESLEVVFGAFIYAH